MRYLQIAELRSSGRAWLSVSLAFVITNFALALSLLAWDSGLKAVARGDMTTSESLGTNFIFLTNAILCALVALPVLASAAELVVASRRASIARLALAGASPAAIIGTLMGQLVAVSVAAAVIGDTVAVALLGPAMNWVILSRSSQGDTVGGLSPVISVVPLLIATALTVVVAVLGGYRVASRAATIPAVEALREAAAEPPLRTSRGRLVGSIVVGVLAVLFSAGSLYLMGTNDLQKGDQVVQGGLMVMALTGIALWLSAPFLVGHVTRAWTSLVRSKSAAWQLATRTVVTRNVRMSRSVTPVMMTVGILLSMLVLGASMAELIRQMYGEEQMAGGSLGALLMVLGLTLLVSLSGAVGNLVMMARQRDAEVALVGISGATPGQQTSLLVLEGGIVAVSGILMGLVMVVTSSAYVYVGLVLYAPIALVRVPWFEMGVVMLACVLLCVLTTTLPSLPSLRQPPQKVVARLIAD